MTSVTGIHHVTAIGGDPARLLGFYAGTLGLRLVKRSVNQDDPGTWHLFFGDATGGPGTAMTLIAWPDGRGGMVGSGQVAEVAFAVPPGAIGWWFDRFLRHGVRHDRPVARPIPGGAGRTETALPFRDPDGLRLALVGTHDAPASRAWDGHAEVPAGMALRGFHAATLWVERTPASERALVDGLGFRLLGREGTTTRLAVGEGGPGQLVDLREIGGFGQAAEGTGTVHHVAFGVPDAAALAATTVAMVAAGLDPGQPVDRYWFRSVYAREPGGVLHEVATAGPGLASDEPPGAMGERLSLPPGLERQRDRIERMLPPLGPAPDGASTSPGVALAERLLARLAGDSRPTDPPTPSAPSTPSSPTETTMSTLDTFHHRFDPATATAPPGAPTLLLLHGTGGDETSLLGLGQALRPGAAMLSPRGNVSEGGAPRFFRRLAEGVLDQEDLAARTTELADWLPVAAAEYGIDATDVVAVGFSNGANIAASLLFRRPEALRAAVLLSPMLPFEPETLPDLSGVGVFIGAGRVDPLVPVAQVERLAELFRRAGAAVTLHWEPGGHQVAMPEVEAAGRFLAALPARG